MHQLIFGNRFDEFPWSVNNLDLVLENIPSFLICEFVYTANFFICLVHLLYQKDERVRMQQGCLFCCALLGGLGNDVIFSFLPLVDNFFHSQAAIMITPRFPLYIFFYYISWLYIPTTLLLNTFRNDFKNNHLLLNACFISLLCAVFYWPWDVVGAKYIWWTWHTTDNSLMYRNLGVPIASTLWTVVFCFTWGLLYRINVMKKKNVLSLYGCIKTVMIIFCFSVPIMMIIMGSMTALTGGVTTPLLLFSVIGFILFFIFISLLVFQKKESTSTTNEIITKKVDNIYWLYLCVLFHYTYLILTIYNFDSMNQNSTGVHQTFGDCGIEGTDISGLKRSIYTCNKDIEMAHVYHSFDNCKNRKQDNTIIRPSMDNNKWYTVCGKEKSGEWIQHATLICIASCITFFFLLRIGSSSSNKFNKSDGKKNN